MTDERTLYIIDSILEDEPGGKKLRLQWERESYGMTNGFYPPVTLQSLLRMFLMSNVSTEAKHFIMMYFLLDVCDYHRDEDIKEQLLSFSIIFFPESKFLSLVEACWLIDHEKFEVNILQSSHLLVFIFNLNMPILFIGSFRYFIERRCDELIEKEQEFVRDDIENVRLSRTIHFSIKM